MSWSRRNPAITLFFIAIFAAICNAQDAAVRDPTSGTIFPADNVVLWRTLSSAIHLLGVSVLAYCIARRSDVPTSGLLSMPIARWLSLLIFADSWLFLFSGGLLISGVGMSLNSSACSAGIFLCIVLYAISKLLIYWFLVEKVHLVHPHPSHSRLKSPAYCLCILFVLGYGVVITLSITGRISFIRDGHQMAQGSMYDSGTDGSCIIGLGRIASTTLLVYDAILNVFFTCMFLHPVYKSTNISPRLKLVAKRTLLAAVVSLVTSAINICVLTILHGQEQGWICLASCAADVAVNAMAIYTVTGSFDDHNPSEPSDSLPTEKGPAMAPAANPRNSIFSGLSAGIKRVFSNPRPQLPIVNAGITSSSRSILEKPKKEEQSSEVVSSTRSVHFSPDMSRQSRGLTVTINNTFGSIDQNDRCLADSSLNVSSSSLEEGNATINHELNPSTRHPEQHGRVSISRFGRREPYGTSQLLLRDQLASGASLSTIECSQVDPSEDISLEVRHERPVPRRAGLIPPIAPTNSRKRSKSESAEPRGEPRGEVVNGNGTTAPLSQTLPASEEVFDRRKVLSALGEIGGGKRKTDANPLEVSVVTQIDRRIERNAPMRDNLVDDYNGRQYDRRGRSWSSSGGF